MASSLYTSYKNNLLGSGTRIDLDSDTIMCALVADEDYTFSAAHTTMSDVTQYSGTTDQSLDNVTIAAGVFDNTADLTFSAVSIDAAKDVDALVLYKQGASSAGTDELIAYIDLPASVTPNGGDITVAFNASGIFTITSS